MNSASTKAKLEKYGKYTEPFIILCLLALFIIPILSVINLSPKAIPTQTTLPPTGEDVLGVQNTSGYLDITLFEGNHSVVTDETLIQNEGDLYTYSTELLQRSKGAYSKPVFEVSNGTTTSAELLFSLSKIPNSSTQVGVFYNETNYVLKASDGTIYQHKMNIGAGQTVEIYLYISNDSNVNFSEEVTLEVLTSQSGN